MIQSFTVRHFQIFQNKIFQNRGTLVEFYAVWHIALLLADGIYQWIEPCKTPVAPQLRHIEAIEVSTFSANTGQIPTHICIATIRGKVSVASQMERNTSA